MALVLWLLTIGLAPSFHLSHAHQPAPLSADVMLIDATGYVSGGVYLGHGLILTSARNVTAERLFWKPTDGQAPQLRHQVWDYVDDDIEHPWEMPLNGVVCPARQKGTYQFIDSTSEMAKEACFAYDLTQNMKVTQRGSSAQVPVENLLYLSREYDIALIAVDAEALETTLPHLPAAHLDTQGLTNTAEIQSGNSVVYVANSIPQWRKQPAQQVADDSQQETQVLAVLDQAPPFGKTQLAAPLIGQAYYSEAGVAGLYWAENSADGAYLTPTSVWVNALWQVNTRLQSPALDAVLNEAVWAVGVAGQPSIGDRFAPELGNTGYDVLHYELNLDIDPTIPYLAGTAVLTSRATYHHLNRFALDLLDDMEVQSVTVAGQPVDFSQENNKLWIELVTPLDFGTEFTTEIAYSGQPVALKSAYTGYFTVGLEYETDPLSLAFANQPDGARSWFPCNDHPLDRATYTFNITVPEGLRVVANGEPAESPAENTYRWEMTNPMASNLATVAVADYMLIADMTVNDIRLRNFVYTGTETQLAPLFNSTHDLFTYFEDIFGAYPYASYGHVITPLENGALETQTMTIMPQSLLQASDESQIYTLVAHELAHQWYGNAVSLKSWGDIWLNEGLATYAEWLALELRYPESDEALRARGSAERRLQNSRRISPLAHPHPPELFSVESYQKGAWVLWMLQEQIGDAAFFEVLQVWGTEYTERPVTTLDFFQLAELISGQDLTQFRRNWLETTTLARYPIHWRVTADGVELQVCNNAPKDAPEADIQVAIQSESEDAQVLVDVQLNNPNSQHFTVDFAPTEIVIDPQQHVLDAIAVEQLPDSLACLSLAE